jgi:hypothetical protein
LNTPSEVRTRLGVRATQLWSACGLTPLCFGIIALWHIREIVRPRKTKRSQDLRTPHCLRAYRRPLPRKPCVTSKTHALQQSVFSRARIQRKWGTVPSVSGGTVPIFAACEQSGFPNTESPISSRRRLSIRTLVCYSWAYGEEHSVLRRQPRCTRRVHARWSRRSGLH